MGGGGGAGGRDIRLWGLASLWTLGFKLRGILKAETKS